MWGVRRQRCRLQVRRRTSHALCTPALHLPLPSPLTALHTTPLCTLCHPSPLGRPPPQRLRLAADQPVQPLPRHRRPALQALRRQRAPGPGAVAPPPPASQRRQRWMERRSTRPAAAAAATRILQPSMPCGGSGRLHDAQQRVAAGRQPAPAVPRPGDACEQRSPALLAAYALHAAAWRPWPAPTTLIPCPMHALSPCVSRLFSLGYGFPKRRPPGANPMPAPPTRPCPTTKYIPPCPVLHPPLPRMQRRPPFPDPDEPTMNDERMPPIKPATSNAPAPPNQPTPLYPAGRARRRPPRALSTTSPSETALPHVR